MDVNEVIIKLTTEFEEAALKMSMKELGDAVEEIGAVAFESLVVQQNEMTKGFMAYNKEAKTALVDAQLLSELHKGDVEYYDDILELLAKSEQALVKLTDSANELSDIPISMVSDILRVNTQINAMRAAIQKTVDAANPFKAIFKEMGKSIEGLGKISIFAGWVTFIISLLKGAAEQMGKWEQNVYAAYGSMAKIAEEVRSIQVEADVLQKEASEAAAAMMEVAIDPKAFHETAVAIARLSAATGASSKTAASFAKQMEVAGLSSKQTAESIKFMEGAAHNFSMTGADADAILQYLSKNAQSLATRAGGSAEAIKKMSQETMVLSGMLKQAGMDASETAQIFQNLQDDALQYVLLLGGSGVNLEDSNKQMALMMENAQGAIDTLKKMPPMIRNSMAKDMYGMDYNALVRLNDARKEQIAQYGSLEKAIAAEKDKSEKSADANRRSANIARQWEEAVQELTNALRTMVTPLLQILQPVFQLVQYIMQFVQWSMPVTKWIGLIVIALVSLHYITAGVRTAWAGLKAVMGGVDFLKSVVNWVIGAGNATKTMGDQTEKGMESAGKGIRKFADEAKKIDAKALLSVAVVLVAVGVAFWLFAKSVEIVAAAIKSLNGDQLKYLAITLAIFGLVLIGVLLALGSAAPVALVGAVVLVAVGAAFILFAAAVYIIAKAAVVFAEAVGLMADAFVKLDSVNIIGILASVAGGFALLGIAMPLIILGAVALGIASLALWAFMKVLDAYSGAVAGLPIFADNIEKAFVGLASGMWSLVDAPYIRFAAAAWFTAKGLRSIFSAMAEIPGGVSVFSQMLNAMSKMEVIATSMQRFKGGFVSDLEDIARAMMKLMWSMSIMRFLGVDKMIESMSVLTVKPAIEDRQRAESDRAEQLAAAKQTNKSIEELTKVISKLSTDIENKSVNEIKTLLEAWLPEIAEGNKGLASATNSWQSSMG